MTANYPDPNLKVAIVLGHLYLLSSLSPGKTIIIGNLNLFICRNLRPITTPICYNLSPITTPILNPLRPPTSLNRLMKDRGLTSRISLFTAVPDPIIGLMVMIVALTTFILFLRLTAILKSIIKLALLALLVKMIMIIA